MKKIAMMLVAGFIIATPAFAFSDVPEDFWAYEKINKMYNDGIISGFEDGTFKPANPITREQAATILTKFFELSESEKEIDFADVTDGYWSEKYIKSVSQYMDIEKIDEKNYFRPQENATRIEIAKAVAKIKNLENEDLSILDKFNDKNTFLEDDEKYIALVVENKIMAGDDKSNFRPNDTITRAEFCAIMHNVYLINNDIDPEKAGKVVMNVNGVEIDKDCFSLYFDLRKKMYTMMFNGDETIWQSEIDDRTVYDIVKEETKDGIIANVVKLKKAEEMGIKLSAEEENELQTYLESETGKQICEFYEIGLEDLYRINSEGKIMSKLALAMYDTIDHSNHNHVDIYSPIETTTYDARHILLSTQGLSDEDSLEAKKLAENLLERVKNGKDFATLANEYSSDGGSNKNGGLYEGITIGKFVSEFEDAALSVEPGEIYPEIVESTYGYHIIKLENKRTVSTEMSQDEKQSIANDDLNEIAQKWIDEANVVINLSVYNSL